MTEQDKATVIHQLDAIRGELAALKDDVRHMKRQLHLGELDPPAPIWNERDRQAVIEFWRKNGRWNGLSDASRRAMRAQLFGRADTIDEVFFLGK